jgi:hypothetical protein
VSKPTKNALRIEFYSLGGSLDEYDPSWSKAYLQERVAELERLKQEATQKAQQTHVLAQEPLPSGLSRAADKGLSVVLISCACVSAAVGSFVFYDWLMDQSYWELVIGVALIAINVWVYRKAMAGK